MNCLIVDDEPMAIKVIESHISQLDELTIVGTCQSALEAFPILQKEEVDILFLDIEMPKLDGLSFLKSLANPPLVLLTTAHRKFAVEGFELDVVDYLLKPISLDRFIQAIAKVYRLKNRSFANPSGNLETNGNSGVNPYIFVRSERENIKINLMEILYIESLKNHVKIYTEKDTHITLISISEIGKKLPSDHFLRIHRSLIVNLMHIDSYTNTYVVIKRKSLPLGNVYKSMVLDVLNKNNLQ